MKWEEYQGEGDWNFVSLGVGVLFEAEVGSRKGSGRVQEGFREKFVLYGSRNLFCIAVEISLVLPNDCEGYKYLFIVKENCNWHLSVLAIRSRDVT